jgi:hypothetical protein
MLAISAAVPKPSLFTDQLTTTIFINLINSRKKRDAAYELIEDAVSYLAWG